MVTFAFALGPCGCETVQRLTHGVPDVNVALASPVVALRERLPVWEHVAFARVCTLPKAVVVQPRGPVVHVARVNLSVSCSDRKRVN